MFDMEPPGEKMPSPSWKPNILQNVWITSFSMSVKTGATSNVYLCVQQSFSAHEVDDKEQIERLLTCNGCAVMAHTEEHRYFVVYELVLSASVIQLPAKPYGSRAPNN